MNDTSKKESAATARECVFCGAISSVTGIPLPAAAFLARYERHVESGHVPDLPRTAMPWPERRQKIAALADELEAIGWSVQDICGLLRELKVRSEFGLDFTPRLLAHARRAFSGQA